MDWNVIVSVNEHGYKAVKILLAEYGKIRSTDYFNVLAMQVEDVGEFLEDMRTLYEMKVPALAMVGRILPVTRIFCFQSASEFEEKAKQVMSELLDELAGKRFYVRMHRRGFKGRLSSVEEEQFLDAYIHEELGKSGKHAVVDFEEPDLVVAIETLGQQAGLSLWTREELQRYPFLKLA